MNRTAKQGGRRSGFTIVEAVVSSVLLAMVLGGAYTLIVRTYTVSRVARDHYVASNLAKNRIERAHNFRYSDLPLLAESKVMVDDNGSGDTEGHFRRTTRVNTSFVDPITGATNTEVSVAVDVRNIRTGSFDLPEQCESNACLFAEM